MDQKFREGNPLDGKPMKRFGEDDSEANALPAPPKIDEVVAGAQEALDPDRCPDEYKGLKCPCGNEWKDCHGFFGMPKEDTFALVKRAADGTL